MGKVKNYFVNFANGRTLLFYVEVEGVDANVIKRFAERVSKNRVTEVYHVPQEDLQYYFIGGRIWIDTPEKAEDVKRFSNYEENRLHRGRSAR